MTCLDGRAQLTSRKHLKAPRDINTGMCPAWWLCSQHLKPNPSVRKVFCISFHSMNHKTAGFVHRILFWTVEGGEVFPETSSSKHPAGNPLTLEQLGIVLFPVLLPRLVFNASQLPTWSMTILFLVWRIIGAKRGILTFPACPTATFILSNEDEQLTETRRQL